MKQNLLKDLPRLRNDNYANIFNVYQDKDNYYFYNLLQTVEIPSSLPANYYTDYNIVYGDTWPLISHKSYQTTNLWWVIIKTNNILNPVEPLQPGTTLKILKPRYVSLILNQITTQ
jgi:nucleoid-associated protein YgaU